MLNSSFVGVAIGLILIYFLLSLLVSGISEGLEAFWRRRARYLEVGIWDILGPLTALYSPRLRHPADHRRARDRCNQRRDLSHHS